MARVLGYGGIANTNALRNFSGKAEAAQGVFTGRRMWIGIGLGVLLRAVGVL
jgi:hypothetical protein